MGFPAGLPRTIVVDLTGKLPAGELGASACRTNLQIYWDQVLVDNGAEACRSSPPGRTSPRLRTPRIPRIPASQVDGAKLQATSPTTTRASAQLARSSGSAAATQNTATSPLCSRPTRDNATRSSLAAAKRSTPSSATPRWQPLPAGWKRDYFFYADGFVKDMDFYEALPFTVAQTALPRNVRLSVLRHSEHYPR